MRHVSQSSLWHVLSGIGNLRNSFLWGGDTCTSLDEVVRGSALDGRADELRGRSVLIATTDQLNAALALLELDGIACRVVLCPPDLPPGQLSYVVDSTAVNAIVTDQTLEAEICKAGPRIGCTSNIVPAAYDRTGLYQTEWVLFTSGTTGLPKPVVHTLASLSGAITLNGTPASPVVWSTFYDIRRYGGLQIFLRAVMTGASLVLSSSEESTAAFLMRAGAHQVTHISGTPSHWRRALMSPFANAIAPRYVRLSGEIADQAILSHLQSCYPQAKLSHAFASTEAGVAFEVNDGLAGVPASLINRPGNVKMKVEAGSLRIHSARTANRYLGEHSEPLLDPEGFVDTGDMVEWIGGRYYFVGRRDGAINVGGLKVHPEEVEAAINCHPRVRMSLVRARRNPITGAVVIADVVLINGPESACHDVGLLRAEILMLCRKALPSHKVPAAISFVSSLVLSNAGKLVRH